MQHKFRRKAIFPKIFQYKKNMDNEIEIKREIEDDEYLENYESEGEQKTRLQTIKVLPNKYNWSENQLVQEVDSLASKGKIKEEQPGVIFNKDSNSNNTSDLDSDDNTENKPKPRRVKAATHLCTICPMKFTRFMDLERHVFRHNGTRNYTCDICHVKFITTNDRNKHMQRHATEAKFPCLQCPDKKFKTIMSLKAHMKLCHYDKEEKVKHLCTECGAIFTSGSTLWMHKRRIHTDIRKFRCAHCEKGFCKQGDLRYHMKSHSDYREFKCDLCPAEYKKKNTLLIHKTEKHGIGNHGSIRRKNQACSYCQERFSLREQLEFHIRRKHTGVKPFQCILCQKKFIRKGYVKDHLKRKHHLSPEQVATEDHFTSNDVPISNHMPEDSIDLALLQASDNRPMTPFIMPEAVYKEECSSTDSENERDD